MVTKMEKFIRDGKVAVLVSPGYGAGWSTWNVEHAEFLCMDMQLVEAVIAGNTSEVVRLVESRDRDIYIGGLSDLRVEWVEQGQAFEIDEYDGAEYLRVVNQQMYMIA
jgi:hypothetical protein